MKWLALLFPLFATLPMTHADAVRVGTKNFTEGYLMGELLAQKLEAAGVKVERKFGLGGTGIVYEALRNDQIDVYVEYTGTLKEALLKDLGTEELRRAGLVLGDPIGFDNTYALAVRREYATKFGLKTLSDLARLPGVRFGITHEFNTRADGFLKMLAAYGIAPGPVELMEHALLYVAIRAGNVDAIEVYSTDGRISGDLVVLRDDRHYFPDYAAVPVASAKFVAREPLVWRALNAAVAGTIDTETMRRLNAAVDSHGEIPRDVMARQLEGTARTGAGRFDWWPEVWRRTREHLALVGWTMLFCILIGVPLGLACLRVPLAAQPILLFSSIVQTIPSLALLCFLIPFFGIGERPALVALFLYGLFPIVTSTYVGISSLPRSHIENARALGLSRRQRLWWVELPMASPHILNGIETSTVWTIGTATLAALIGAGGYGAPIVTGLAMNSIPTILTGAIPAAVLALVAHVFFHYLARALVPKGLRK